MDEVNGIGQNVSKANLYKKLEKNKTCKPGNKYGYDVESLQFDTISYYRNIDSNYL